MIRHHAFDQYVGWIREGERHVFRISERKARELAKAQPAMLQTLEDALLTGSKIVLKGYVQAIENSARWLVEEAQTFANDYRLPSHDINEAVKIGEKRLIDQMGSG